MCVCVCVCVFVCVECNMFVVECACVVVVQCPGSIVAVLMRGEDDLFRLGKTGVLG